jgi:flagellar motor switch protein FliG
MTAAELTGIRRAAIALLSLDEDLASRVLSKLSESEIMKLYEAVADIGDVGGDVIRSVLEELERCMCDPLAMARTGGNAYMRRLADRAFGSERAQQLFKEHIPPPEPLVLLRTARINVLAKLLSDEHPQIAAMVLTQLPTSTAAKILNLLDPGLAADLTNRISQLDEVPALAIAEASESLVKELELAGGLASSDARTEFDGLAFSAAIVNEMSSEVGDDLLAGVAGIDEQAAARIREALFTFDDLLRIPKRELGALMRAVQSEMLVTALQTATLELREHLLGSLSQRAADTLRDDLASAPPKRVSEVETAQREVVAAANQLAEQGKLTLPSRGE